MTWFATPHTHTHKFTSGRKDFERVAKEKNLIIIILLSFQDMNYLFNRTEFIWKKPAGAPPSSFVTHQYVNIRFDLVVIDLATRQEKSREKLERSKVQMS